MKLRVLIVLLLMSSSAFASNGGVGDGGGGKGVVCRDTSGKISHAETLDLFEARKLYGLSPRRLAGSLETVLVALESELSSTMDQPELHLFPLIDRAQRILHLVDSSVIIKPVDDAAEVAVPVDCKIEQLASYVNDNLLLVSLEIWNRLDVTNQASLILHEAIYRLERSQGATNSRRTRMIVGHVISGFTFIPVRAGIPTGAQFCSANNGVKMNYQFAYFPTQNGKMSELQFFIFDGNWVFSKKTAILPMKFPWDMQQLKVNCDNLSKGCNVAGGTVSSNFEGDDFITLGFEQVVTNGTVASHYYFESAAGRSQIECSSFL